jgi:putative flippase GtrA
MLIGYMNQALIIPIYQPNDKVLPFLKSFAPNDFTRFIVVDDGSGENYDPIFEEIKKLPNFLVLSYPDNGGKGHALKMAFSLILKVCPDVEGVVTADGDGQHLKEDILHVRDELALHPTSLVMGVRDFSGKNVPTHNRLGNRFSSFFFHLSSGVKLGDTQTGLRGIPGNLFALALESEGERYEYEMNFLNEAVKMAPLIQVKITTVYDDNKSSHFHPFRDSVRIYKTPLLYLLEALTSWGIDEGLFALFTAIGPDAMLYKVLVGVVAARVISGSYNFILNYLLVFNNRGGFARKLMKYTLVFLINMGLSFGLTYAFSFLPTSLVFIKFVVDIVLFIANYFVSKAWIFAKKKAWVPSSKSPKIKNTQEALK